ncbi:MAG: exodeoxyribonuclease VII small subunit [Xanthomonadales bacterium]|nr:exodeoxyribonuclease VII small subunit [Xanthomonadales bacterium]
MTQQDARKPDFEKALAELEQLVEKLEAGELSLDQSLEHFRRGVELTRHCQQTLENAQLTVERLIEDEAANADGDD